VVSNSYYNIETSRQTSGIGYDNNSQTVKALTTAAMKQNSSFVDWNFTDNWKIEENITFPCLVDVPNVPVILHTLSLNAIVNETYIDTIQVVCMSNQDVSIELLSYPEGMTLTQDSIISYTPTSRSSYTIEIGVTDGDGLSNYYTYTIYSMSLTGSGTESNPYRISSLDDLQQLSELSILWDKYFIQTSDIDASETGTWNDGAGFSPIGSEIAIFTGNYQGQGYTIDNLIINRPLTSYIGLFGYTSTATIDSLGLTNVNVQGDSYVGGLVGYNCHSIVSNSYSVGSVVGSGYVGGLVGHNKFSSAVSNSYSSGSVSGNYYIGGLVGENCYATVSNSYSVSSVSGSDYVGGLVGDNKLSSTLSNSYSTGLVTGRSLSVGGLVGENSSGTISHSYYNIETSGQTSGIGDDEDSQTVTGLTTSAMKQSSNFNLWDFTNTWSIRADSIYPVLLGVSNNAPFAFDDTLMVAGNSSLLTNDYDYETGQEVLTCKLISTSTNGSISNGAYSFNTGTTVGTSDTITYCVGELLASGDILWGNYATAILIKADNTAPVLLTSEKHITINEDTSLKLTIDNVTVSDVNGDVLSLVFDAGDNYSVSGNTITPDANFNGTLTVPAYVTDGELNSDTLNISVTVKPVNDAPILTSVKDATINEEEVLTLSLDDVTANDVEDDALSLVIAAGDNYSVNGTTITPDAGFSGTLTVSVAVSDGELMSNSMDMTITIGQTVSIHSTEQNATDINVYPNPATTILYVSGSTGIAYLYNLTGKLVLSQDLSQSASINISGLSNGVYLLKVDGAVVKVVKE
jgi:hypothetical protein